MRLLGDDSPASFTQPIWRLGHTDLAAIVHCLVAVDWELASHLALRGKRTHSVVVHVRNSKGSIKYLRHGQSARGTVSGLLVTYLGTYLIMLYWDRNAWNG